MPSGADAAAAARPHGHGVTADGRGRGFGRPGGWQQADLPPADDAHAWLVGRLPDGWYTGEPTVTVDREEILVIGELPGSRGAESGAAAAEGASSASARTPARRA